MTEEKKAPSVEQLKARAYDLLTMQERINAELRAINQAIAEASKPILTPEEKPIKPVLEPVEKEV